MNKNILRTARRFLHKELNGKVDFSTVERYLNKSGYVVLFYDENKSLEFIKEYDMVEYSKSCNAFTVVDENRKYVFINKGISSQDMLYAILHETGHIILNHLEENLTTADKTAQELEADAFAYNVLYPQSNTRICKTIAICTTALCLGAMAVMIKQDRGVSDT